MSNLLQNIDMVQIMNIVLELQNPKALANAQHNPVKFFAQFGIGLPAQTGYELHLNDQQTFYFILPSADNSEITEELLAQMAAGKALASSLSTVSSAGTAGSLLLGAVSTFSCVFTASSAIDSDMKAQAHSSKLNVVR